MPANNRLNRRIWQIAWPAILSNASIPMLGLVDTAILGHLDSTVYLGAVAVGTSILSFLYWGFGFLRMGTTGLVARAAGAGLHRRELEVVLQSAVLAFGIGVLVMTSSPLWMRAGLTLMAPGETMAPLVAEYIGIRVFSAPAVLLTYTTLGWFIGRQNTRWPMLILVFTNTLNILLDIWFVVVLDWRSAGAAWATLCAEYAGLLLAASLVIKRLDWQLFPAVRASLGRWGSYRELLLSNRDLFIRTAFLLFSFAFFTAMSTRLGPTALAANTIMLNLLMLAAYALDGFAYAAEGLAGNAAGAADLPRFREAVAACWRWTLLTAVCISLLYLGGGPLAYPLFTAHAEVIEVLTRHQLWLVLMPLLAAPSYLLDGVFIGAVRTRYMMWSMLISVGAVYLPLWWALQGFGNHGLWLSFLAFNGARGVTLWWYFRALDLRGGWLD